MGEGQRILQRSFRAVGRWHQQGPHLLTAQGRNSQGGHQGRINAATEPEQGCAEAAFAGVVLHPEHEHAPELGLGAQGLRWGWTPGGLAVPNLQRALPAGQLLLQRPSGIQHKAVAIKNQLVVSPHLIDVEHWASQPLLGGPRQLTATLRFALAKGGRREVDQ